MARFCAFIIDGNRRYAKKLKLEEGAGHNAGFLSLISLLHYCGELGVMYFVFSIDNFKRKPDQVQKLMDLLLEKINWLLKEETEKVMKAIVDNNRGSAFNPSGLCLKR
ncbi:hypothetical protein CUMW_285970 [Citrus unshiu]|uniref:Alkyl transferase n=1 Tax=Citrus unshiu TaxID=55188 RepID=A0A2H5N4I1_CITUN|nr:hypothetical protein CUMW_285970 [Citrus unshiu]